MELVKSNWGWIILFIIVVSIYLYKIIVQNKDALTSKFTVKQILPLPVNASLHMSKQALKNAKFINVGLDSNENRLYAKSGFSMSSWSEFIQVKAHEMDNSTEIEFKSICALPTQVFDWGKNKSNYKRFEKELNKLTNANTF